MQIDKARRIALAAQGFSDPSPKGTPNVRHFRRSMRRMSLLQLDSVQYLCRSHYLPIFSRIGPYSTAALDHYTHKSDELIEVWGHEASLVPAWQEPLFRWRKQQSQRGEVWSHLHRFAAQNTSYVRSVLSEVRERGALRPSELSDPRIQRGTSSWGNSNGGRLAMEWMFRTGELGARRDARFHRVFDIPERILPAEIIESKTPSESEAKRRLLSIAAQSHGIGSLGCLADYHRIRPRLAAPHVDQLVEEGELRQVSVEGWEGPLYVHRDAKCPRAVPAKTLLSPFDPLVWNRKRIAKLFSFDYKIEIYVPEAKRQYGYYVSPFLLGDSLVGRLELKSDRANGRLLVRGAWIEAGHNHRNCARAMAESILSMASHLKLESVVGPRKGNLSKELRAELP
ncbi:MAG: YcaQ family DNA glycosylase [Kofleriaceae bacterium]|nr:YcaQ family DNA glycosylase [Kofleriaceae bacterium]